MKKTLTAFAVLALSCLAPTAHGAPEPVDFDQGVDAQAAFRRLPAAPSVPASVQRSKSALSPSGFVSALLALGLADKETVDWNLKVFLARTEDFIAQAKDEKLDAATRKKRLGRHVAAAYQSLKEQAEEELPAALSGYADALMAPMTAAFSRAADLVKQEKFAEASALAKELRAELKLVQAEVK